MVSAPPADGVALGLGPAASAVRGHVGPVAWVVLERLAETATGEGDGTVSLESVRGLAASLGLAKDTVARALQRLAAAGLIAHVPTRCASGRFGAGHYLLTLPADLFVGLAPITSGRSAFPHGSTHSPHRPSCAVQLTLLDADASPS